MTVTVMAATLPELRACSTCCMITPGEVVVISGEVVVISVSFVRLFTVVDLVVCCVVSVGIGSVVTCGKGVGLELCSSAVGSGEVGPLVGLVLFSEKLWLELTEVEDTSGDVDDRGESDVAGT